jgi:hypothetical protein
VSRRVTISLLIAFTLILIVWDIYAAANSGDGDTISEITLGFARKHPALPFAIGVICGHLLWPQRPSA